jgi:hypothetical protein
MQRLEVSGAVRHIYIYIYVIRRRRVNRQATAKTVIRRLLIAGAQGPGSKPKKNHVGTCSTQSGTSRGFLTEYWVLHLSPVNHSMTAPHSFIDYAGYEPRAYLRGFPPFFQKIFPDSTSIIPRPLALELFSSFSSIIWSIADPFRCAVEGSEVARLLGLRVRIPPRARMSVSCECSVLSGRGLSSGWSLVQRSATECGVSECDQLHQ